MKFGPVPPKRVPKQDSEKVLLLAERWQRAAYAHQRWAEPAKTAVDFFENRQWTADQIAAMTKAQRPALTFNIIAPVVRLVLGYQRNNKTDITFQPGQDARSSEQVAEALSRVEKAIAERNNLAFVDTEVFLDGLVAGRGYFDTRLSFENNDLGEIETKAADPFTVYIDPDADTYDLNQSAGFVMTSKFVSIDEIEAAFGKKVAHLVKPFTLGQTPLGPISSLVVNDEITPIRAFGEHSDTDNRWWDSFYSMMGDFVDRQRKTIRIIECQHKVREERNVVIDLETGDKKVLPADWGNDKIQKVLLYAQTIGNPLVVQRRMVERIQWTTMAGDLILYDAPSLYERYTLTGYFPYFRRGVTRGMVEDLIDAQKEKNKRRSAQLEVVAKTANGGWKYHETSLDPVQEANLRKFGSTPGVNVKWKGEHEPQQIQPSAPPVAHERLELRSDEDVRRISGINESALGEIDKVQSGRAIEARQRQAVISVQVYMDNFARSKQLLGEQHLGIIQNHYTEERLYRVMGEDGKFVQQAINQAQVDPFTGVKRIINDVTVGKYVCVIDQAPLSATFASAQFEEMMAILEKLGPALAPVLPGFADLIIGMSSLPRKDDWINRLQQISNTMAQPQQPGMPGQPQQVPQQAPQQALPAPQPQAAGA